jgi:hypothetical protein
MQYQIKQLVSTERRIEGSSWFFFTEAVSRPEYGLFCSYDEARKAAEGLGEDYIPFPA